MNSAKLRARQKERLAQRNAVEESRPSEGLAGPVSVPQCPSTNPKEGDATELNQSIKENISVIDLEDDKVVQPVDAPKSKTDSPLRLSRISKYRMSSHLDFPVNPRGHPSPDIFLPSHQFQSTSYTNSVPTSNLLPVLGLCAPNANQLEPSYRNFSRSNGRQSKPGTGPDFPFSLAPCSGTSIETLDNAKKPDASAEILQQRLKNSIPDNCHPYVSTLSLFIYIYDCECHPIIVYVLNCHAFSVCSALQLSKENLQNVWKVLALLSLIFKKRWHCQTYHLMKKCCPDSHFQLRPCQLHILTTYLACP